MSSVRERVVAEKEDLDGKLEKLSAFLSSPRISEISVKASVLLHEQRRTMLRYSMILASRLALLDAESKP